MPESALSSNRNIIYIYNNDLDTAREFQTFIETNTSGEYSVNLETIPPQVTDFTTLLNQVRSADLLIIGGDTMNQNNPANWFRPGFASEFYNLNIETPVVAIGNSGFRFLQISLDIHGRANNTMGGKVIAANADVPVDSNVWHIPFELNVKSGDVLDLYHRFYIQHVLDILIKTPSPGWSAVVYGWTPGWGPTEPFRDNYSPVFLLNSGESAFWGFQRGPDAMTLKGKELFINILTRLLNDANTPPGIIDHDMDGIVDNDDNCPETPNANQLDTDGDGLGDACDADDDGDALTDYEEGVFGTDPADSDTDGDGTDDLNDAAPLDPDDTVDSDRMESRITSHPTVQYSPDISGSRIVWRDSRNGNYDIYMYDMATGEEMQITTDPDLQESPAICGDRIVSGSSGIPCHLR
jgi:beta propeller repeat protein